MRTLTGLSGEYVTFEQNVQKCSFAIEFLSTKIKNIDLGRLMVLMISEVMNDWTNWEGLVLTDMLIFKISIWT